MDIEFFNLLGKILNEGQGIGNIKKDLFLFFQKRKSKIKEQKTAPIEKPITTPKREQKPKNPLTPHPGIKPTPKDLFIIERIQFPSWVHPDKKDWIIYGDIRINKILPQLSNSEQTYLEMISRSAYEDLVKKIEKYAGINLDQTPQNLPSLVGLFFSSIEKINNIEKEHRKELEELAIKCVLDLDEFDLVRHAIEDGILTIKATLSNIRDFSAPEPQEDDPNLSDEEIWNIELTTELEDIVSEDELRRKMANLLIQGGAVSKLYLFHMISSELDKINPKLKNLYGLVAVLAELGYWITPDGIEPLKGAAKYSAGGFTKVEPETFEDRTEGYVITAQACTFPYLVHEITKGIYEWISIDPIASKALSPKEEFISEPYDILIGPAVVRQITRYIPSELMYLLPLVYKKYLQLPIEKMKEVLKFSDLGNKIIKEILDEAKKEYDEYILAKESSEEEKKEIGGER